MNTGKILTVSGPVVDCGFETGQLPAIREALHVTLHGEVRVMEVVQQLSATRVRCVLLGASEQLSRGMPVKATGTGIQVPVGEATLGRMFNVLGEPIDGEGALPSETPQWEIHRKPPVFSEQRPATELLETGIKVIDLLEPYPKGGKIGNARERCAAKDGAGLRTDERIARRAHARSAFRSDDGRIFS